MCTRQLQGACAPHTVRGARIVFEIAIRHDNAALMYIYTSCVVTMRQQDGQRRCTHKGTLRRDRQTTVAAQSVSVRNSECVFLALVTEHAERMRHSILS